MEELVVFPGSAPYMPEPALSSQVRIDVSFLKLSAPCAWLPSATTLSILFRTVCRQTERERGRAEYAICYTGVCVCVCVCV